MEKYNKFRIEWDCRRGMLELDKIIMPFFQKYFDSLSNEDKDTFLQLLACSDLQLFSWFFNNVPVQDAKLQMLVNQIQSKIIKNKV